YALISERNSANANARRVVNRVGDSCNHWSARRLARSIWRKIGPIRIGVSVNQHHVDLFRCISVPERRMRHPIHAGYFLSVELHLFVKRAAHAVEQVALDGALQTQG